MRWLNESLTVALALQLGLATSGCGGTQSPGAGDPTITVEGSSILIVDESESSSAVKIPFEVDSHVLREASYRPLDVLAEFVNLREDYTLIEVHGHSDERGSEAYNQSLSTRRAASVIDYLVGQGVDRSRLRAKGFGSSRPAVLGTGKSAWSRNRRVEFVIAEHRDR